MKKKIISLITSLCICVGLCVGFLSTTVEPAMAAGMSISPSSYSVTAGGSVYVTVTISSANPIYAYNISISGGGALSGGKSFAEGANGEYAISVGTTLYAAGTGTGYISAEGSVSDGMTADWGSNGTSISVVAPSSGGTGGGTGTGGGAGGNSYLDENGNAINDKEVKPGSDNMKLSSMGLASQGDSTTAGKSSSQTINLKDEGNNIYSATVTNDTKTIDIDFKPEDANATVSGNGTKELKVGENVFEIVVTAENGLQTAYTIKIYRKDDKVTLADFLDEVLNGKSPTVLLRLSKGDIITPEMWKAIKKSGKTIFMNSYSEPVKEGETEKLESSWVIKGANVPDDMGKFDPSILPESKNQEKIDTSSNFVQGQVVSLAYSGQLPKETQLIYGIDEVYEDGTELNMYYFNPDDGTLELVQEGITVAGGYATMDLDHASEYLLTRATVIGGTITGEQKTNPSAVWIMLAEGIVIVGLLAVIFVLVLSKRKKDREALAAADHTAEINLPKEYDFSQKADTTDAPEKMIIPNHTNEDSSGRHEE